MGILTVRRPVFTAALLSGFHVIGLSTAHAESTPEGDLATFARTADAAKTKGAAARDRVVAAETANATQVDDRKTKEKALEERKKAVKKRIKDASSAFKKYQAAAAKGKVTEKEQALLTSAQTDFQAAVTEGKAITTDVAALHKVEDDIEARLQAATADTDVAVTSATDAKGAAKSAADTGRTLVKDVNAEVSHVKKAADGTKRVAQMGSPADYPKKKTKNEDSDGKLQKSIAEATQTLAALPKAGGK